MKLIDRIIFGFIAVCLGILAARAFMPLPVRADYDGKEILKVNVYEIGGHYVSKYDFVKK